VGASDDLHARALRVTPGGVHSPVRAFRQVGGTPVYMREAHGARITDVEGREYIDFCLAFGPLILGHGDPGVVAAVRDAATRGFTFGTADPYSLQLAETITSRLPWVEQVRFLTSGTEAVMTALRIARAATGRTKLLKFEGCYHGHADSMLVEAGSGMAGEPAAASAGVPAAVVADTRVCPLDDEAALTALFDREGGALAAAIIEPLPANFGLLPQRQEFLARLAALCRQHDVLLIFDEVISGFRTGFGGMAGLTGIRPDLVTYGKIIGGGLGVAACGGRADLMQQLAPAGPVYQAGTLAANPLGMAAGQATLDRLADGTAYLALEDLGQLLDDATRDLPGWTLVRHGSVCWLHPADAGPPRRAPGALTPAARARYATLFHRLLAAGIYFPPSAAEVFFLSTAHSDEDVVALAEALHEAAT
jgi:glutamate-1-semialdehyde 2,1-aminomutase